MSTDKFKVVPVEAVKIALASLRRVEFHKDSRPDIKVVESFLKSPADTGMVAVSAEELQRLRDIVNEVSGVLDVLTDFYTTDAQAREALERLFTGVTDINPNDDYDTVRAYLDQMAWKPIETAPNNSRVIVSGWQPPLGSVAGYWWTHEDNIINGKPFDYPHAKLWTTWPTSPKEHTHDTDA